MKIQLSKSTKEKDPNRVRFCFECGNKMSKIDKMLFPDVDVCRFCKLTEIESDIYEQGY